MALKALDFPLITNTDTNIRFYVYRQVLTNGTPTSTLVNLTGATIVWNMFAPGTTTAVLNKSGDDIGPLNQVTALGAFDFQIAAADTVLLPGGVYPHEATIFFADGTTAVTNNGDYSLSYGNVNLRQQL